MAFLWPRPPHLKLSTDHDNFGMFPLPGKFLNVCEAKRSHYEEQDHPEYQDNKDYSSTGTLRCGRLLLMTGWAYQ